MNSRERISLISSLYPHLKSGSLEVTKQKVWKSKFKFSERFLLSKIVENKSLNGVSDDHLHMLSSIFVDKSKPAYFKSKEHTAEFLSVIMKEDTNVSGIDSGIIGQINDVYESIKREFPSYSPNDSTTWGANMEIANSYHRLFFDIVDSKKLLISQKQMQLYAISKKVFESTIKVVEGKKDLYSMIYDVLDENSIMLLHGFIFGDMTPYTEAMRDKVYEYLKKNPTSPAVDMVVGEITDDEVESLRRQFNYYDRQSFMASKSFVGFRKNTAGKLCLIKYAGNNKCKIKEIN